MIYNTLLRVSASTLVDSLTTEWSFPSQALINESFSSEALSPTLNPSLSYWWTEREARETGFNTEQLRVRVPRVRRVVSQTMLWFNTESASISLLWGEGCVLYVWLWFWYDEILIIFIGWPALHRGIPGGNTEIAKITHKLRVFLYKLREKCN